MPMITSMLAWAVTDLGVSLGLPYHGIGQQGESIMFPANLPEFKSIENVTVEVIAASGNHVYMLEVNEGESQLPGIGTKGVYFIKLTDRRGGVRTEKVVVE